jgi:hypothetical protein
MVKSSAVGIDRRIVEFGSGGVLIRYTISAGSLIFNFSGHGVSSSYATSKLAADTWYHIAWSINTGKVYFFVNGILVNAGGSTVTSTSTSASNICFGGSLSTNSVGIEGCIDNVRLIIGSSYWTSNFTPSLVPYVLHNTTTAVVLTGYNSTSFNPDYQNVCLQLHFDTDFNDYSKYKVIPSTGANTAKYFLSTEHSAVGSSASLRLINDNSGGGIALAYSNIPDYFLQGSYSVKARVRLNSYPQTYGASFFEVFGVGAFTITGTLNMLGGVSAPGGIGCLVMGTPLINGNSQYAKVLNLNTWYSLETTRSKDGTRKLYVDGVLIGTDSTKNTIPNNWTTSTGYGAGILIGAYGEGRQDSIKFYWGSASSKTGVDCWIDEVSISVGGEYLAPYSFSNQKYPDSGIISSGYIDITATRTGIVPVVLTKRVPIYTTINKSTIITSSLSNYIIPIRARYDGVGNDYSSSNTKMSILVDGVEDSQNWSFTSGIAAQTYYYSGNISGSTINITNTVNESTDNKGCLVAYRHGYPCQYQEFNIVKTKDVAVSTATLSNPVIYINCDYLGNPISGAFNNAFGTAEGKVNGIVDTNYYAHSTNAISNVTVTYQYNSTLGKYTYAITGISADTGYVDINVRHSNNLYPPVVSRVNVSKLKATKPIIVGILDISSIFIEGDTNGDVPASSYTGKSVQASIYLGDISNNDSANWSFSATASSGITFTKTGNNVFNITALTNAFTTGTLVITASKNGETNIIQTCNIIKLKQLAPSGLVQNNDLGTSYDYVLSQSAVNIITFKTDGRVLISYLSNTITKNWYSPTTTSIGNNYFLTVTGTGSVIDGLTGNPNDVNNPTNPWTFISGITLGTANLLTSDISIGLTSNYNSYGQFTYNIRANNNGVAGSVLAVGTFNTSAGVDTPP